jgi:TolB protein
MEARGGPARRLTRSPGPDGWPAWSPDGRRLAFVSERSGGLEVYVMGADGSRPALVTADRRTALWPAWSPDGRRLAYQSYARVRADVYIVGADGSGARRLTDAEGADTGAEDGSPAWSPDGRLIAFSSDREERPARRIYVIESSGGSLPRRLTDSHSTDDAPAWSPDGRLIAFHSTRDGSFEVYVMAADGSGARRLTSSGGSAPRWSPDGRWIAYTAGRSGRRDIRLMRADGSGDRRLTEHPADDAGPSWAP